MLKTNVDDISCILHLKFPFRQNICCLWSLKNKNLRSGCYESLVLISICQLFHIHQLSRLVSIAVPWSILPVLGLSALLINTYMTEKSDLFLSISVQIEEHNCRNLSLKKIGLKAEAFLGLLKGISMFTMQKQLQKTCLITSGVLNQFLLDWAKEGDKKSFGPFQICVTNYTVNLFSTTGNWLEPSLVHGLCTGAAAHASQCSTARCRLPSTCPTHMAGTPQWSLELWGTARTRFTCHPTSPSPLPCHSLGIIGTPSETQWVATVAPWEGKKSSPLLLYYSVMPRSAHQEGESTKAFTPLWKLGAVGLSKE